MLQCSIGDGSRRRFGGEHAVAGLADLVAELVASGRTAAGGEPSVPLKEVANFGDNPGALRMFVYAPEELEAGASARLRSSRLRCFSSDA